MLNFVYVWLTCAWLSAWYQMGILENAGSRLFWNISDFVWLLCVCLVSQSLCVWKLREHLKIVICTGDRCALLKGFRILFWTQVSGVQSYISVGKVNLVRWCRLNADREDCLCDRQIVGFDNVCKFQWNDFLESLFDVTSRKPPPKTKNVFFYVNSKTCWIRRGFEQLSSSSGWWFMAKKADQSQSVKS